MPRRAPQFTLPIGKAIGTSIAIYLRNFVPFTLLGAFVMAPWIALRILMPVENMETPEETAKFWAGILLSALLGFVLTGALTYGVVQQLRGSPAGMADALARGAQAFLRVLGTGLLAGLRIALGFILCYIPGIYETVRLFVAIPAAVMEGKGAVASIDRSIRLTEGSRWQILGAWFVAYVLIVFGLMFVAYFVYGMFSADEAADTTFLDIGITLVTAPIQATCASVVYFLLRQGKEHVAVEDLAAVFD